MTEPATVSGDDILSCANVWKFYGPKAHQIEAGRSRGISAAQLYASPRHLAAVRDVSLSVKRGEILVLMGLSGSGKSTLLRCMTRLVTPTYGSVFFDGLAMGELDARRLMQVRREKMGMVFQGYGLLPHMTALQNVSFPMRIKGVEKARREERAREMLALVGLDGREDHYPDQLSGGQQQRVGIARSLTLEPDIWFLDEPFSALDPLVRREMQDEVMRLQTILRKSIVFVTHDCSEAMRLADRIAIMKDGEIVQLSTPEQLVLSPANDYVAAFTRDVRRAEVLTVASVMDHTASAAGLTGPTIQARDKIVDVAGPVLSATDPVRVLGSDGAAIGAISRNAVLAVLLSGTARAHNHP
ncbi:ATP-binding cassette domain-containing protein [Mesorhizobium sp. M4B.F.Ca.ET.169.01.1.1]|uniref:quaternary amine ABC transporter ATP-binding protein n=1 Tax=unclassified Mesorhizobium TaxID=325217 RepID=UPI000FCB138D|nr:MULTISPECIES: betaine/proline/choline family ABC transporter ATP-binding protein [unclassified Mesorhizobium]RVD46314.1 ATP-binding cassette domain-containing protein [Mesorhizobium sp. M4B.F.Ca.ET.019.03.1.1]TGT37771.1 ATP-binding cassette domain-containing protein [Mesorhizobium sp. M4B.F.Ca.ET.169.01.1.1]